MKIPNKDLDLLKREIEDDFIKEYGIYPEVKKDYELLAKFIELNIKKRLTGKPDYPGCVFRRYPFTFSGDIRSLFVHFFIDRCKINTFFLNSLLVTGIVLLYERFCLNRPLL